MRSSRVNIGLAVLVAVLALAAWLIPKDRNDPPELTPLTPLNSEDVADIEVHSTAGTSFLVHRLAGGWRMTQPYNLPANGPRIELLLALLGTPVYEQFGVEADRLKEFGLSPPRAWVRFDNLTISLGDLHPFNQKRYIGIGNTVYLIKDLFAHHLQAGSEAFLSTRLLPEELDISEIHTPQWRLFRRPGAQLAWHLEPLAEGISMDLLVDKVDAWRNAQAIRVDRRVPAKTDDIQTVWIRAKEREFRFLILPAPTPRLYVEATGLSYELPALKGLLEAPGERAR